MTRVWLVAVLAVAACGDDDGGGPPSILSRTPDEGADNVYVGDPIEVVFSEAIAPGTQVTLTDDGGRTIEHQDSWSADQTTLRSIITGRPAAPTAVTIMISGAADADGHAMPVATWSWQLPMWQQPGGALNVDQAMPAGDERLAVDSQRRMVVAWSEQVDQIRVKRLAGSSWETLGDALGGTGARSAVVAIDAADRPVVAWVEGGTTTTAQAARWDGSAWTALPSPGPAMGLAMAADAAGVIYVAVEGTAADVVVSRLTAADVWESLGGPTSSGIPGTTDSSASIALAISGDGPVVAWSVQTSSLTSEIRTARLAANGATGWENTNILNRSVPSTARYPDLTIDSSGHPVVAWEEYDGVSIDVSVATLASTDNYWQLLGRTLDVDLLDHARWPGVGTGPDGTIFVAWSEFHGAVQRLWVARSQAGGDWEFVGGQAVNRDPGSLNALPKLAVLDRWPVVVWQESEGFDWTASKVWVRRYNGNDVRLPGLTARPTTTGCSFDPVSTTLLSQTGCFTVGPDPIPDPGLIPFDINSHLWSDGALKRRWLVIPDGETVQPTDVDGWTMPVGTMILKEFALQVDENDPRSRRPIETRFLVKRDAQNNWEGFSFQWSDDFSDATLLPPDPTTKDWTITTFSGSEVVHTHTYPGRDQCLTCHALAANVVLGVTSKQLSRFYDYAGVVDQELEAMDRIGLFASPLAGLPANPMTRPSDMTQIAELRARGYLAANCAHCHRPGGARPTRDMRWETPLGSTMLCADGEIVPGAPGSSVLYQRMSARPGMPPLATLIPDPFALDLMSRWIGGMTTCP